MTFTKQQVDENTEYKAGHAISLEDRTISVKFDSTLCLNAEGKLSCINSSSGGSSIEYSEGDGIRINNHKISANIDGSTIKVNDKNQLYTENSGKIYQQGSGIDLSNDVIKAKVDNKTIKFNNADELTAIEKSLHCW